MLPLFTFRLARQARCCYLMCTSFTSEQALMVAATKPVPSPAATPTDLAARLWSEDLPRQHGFEPLEVEGTLPAELRGTLFRNGPGQFGQFGRRYGHPFEGDGAVTAIRLGGGRAL